MLQPEHLDQLAHLLQLATTGGGHGQQQITQVALFKMNLIY